MRTTFVSRANMHRAQFWFLHDYPLHVIFVSRADILCAFQSTHCTMPNFRMTPTRTNTLRTQLTKLSHDNISPHYARTNQTPLCSNNTVHTTHAIKMCVYSKHTLLCVCTPCNDKFSACTNMPISCRAMPNFTYHKIFTAHHAFLVCPPVHIHFYAHQFLMNFAAEIGAFGLTFFPNLP
jgi:hypothetical protein